jgi:hypothetical protein
MKKILMCAVFAEYLCIVRVKHGTFKLEQQQTVNYREIKEIHASFCTACITSAARSALMNRCISVNRTHSKSMYFNSGT